MLDDTTILVFGARRPVELSNTLESLRRQGVMRRVHVWLDGHQGVRTIAAQTAECERVAAHYKPANVVAHRGRIGIDKMMLDALREVSSRAVIVLEDDCFPTSTAVEEFLAALQSVKDDPTVFSVYGHPFGVPGEGPGFPRFQGWGWAAFAERLEPIVARAREAFQMSERAYLAFADAVLTQDIKRRLAVTPGRDPVAVARSFYSWDAVFCLLTAAAGMSHLRTPRRVIYNCGMGADSTHFPQLETLRKPPYNLITADEVWNFFEP